MSVEEQRILCRLLRLALPRFFVALSNNAYEFFIGCKDKTYNFCLVETGGVDYTTFKMDAARH